MKNILLFRLYCFYDVIVSEKIIGIEDPRKEVDDRAKIYEYLSRLPSSSRTRSFKSSVFTGGFETSK